MKVSQLKAHTRTIPVFIPGEEGEAVEEVAITFRPGSMTFELWEKMQEMSQNPEAADTEAMLDFLFADEDPLLIGWDLQNDDDSQFECTRANVKKLPLPFIGYLFDAIGTASFPNASRGATSGASSQQTAPWETSPTGTESSEQQTASDAAPGSS